MSFFRHPLKCRSHFVEVTERSCYSLVNRTAEEEDKASVLYNSAGCQATQEGHI